MSKARAFRLVPSDATASHRRELRLLDPMFAEPIYIIDNNTPSDTAMVRTAKQNKFVGTVTATTASAHTSFTVTGTKDVRSNLIRMKSTAPSARTIQFTFDLDTPSFLRQQVEWQHTEDVPSWADKSDAVNLKLVYAGTSNVIARFIHKPSTLHITEGTFEMHENHGPGWDLTVFLSCLAVLKYASLNAHAKSTRAS